jgi:hypothetical protein
MILMFHLNLWILPALWLLIPTPAFSFRKPRGHVTEHGLTGARCLGGPNLSVPPLKAFSGNLA